jgi:hypothetical protein
MEPTSPRIRVSRRTLLLVLLGLLWMIPQVLVWAHATRFATISAAPSLFSLAVLALVIATLVQGLRGNPLALSVLAVVMVFYGLMLVGIVVAGGASRGVIAVGLCFLAMAIVVLLLRADVMQRLRGATPDTPILQGR